MNDNGKSIDDFSEKVSTTIRQYVKDDDALQNIANVLDDMSDQAYHDGYEEGYTQGLDVNLETAEEVASDQGYEYGYDEGKYDAQKEMLENFTGVVNNIIVRYANGEDAGLLLGDINLYVQRMVDEFDTGNN